jgi:hypothetical protein
MSTLLLTPEHLDPAINPHTLVVRVNADTDLKVTKKRYGGKISDLFATHSYTRNVLEASSSSGSDGERDAQPAQAPTAAPSRAGGSKGGKGSKGLGVHKKKKKTTLRGARYAIQIESLFLGLDQVETARRVGHSSIHSQKAYQKCALRSGGVKLPCEDAAACTNYPLGKQYEHL